MTRLPKRPSTYISALLLIVLFILVLWMQRALTSPELMRALEMKREQAAP